jgi:hypothetical protein
VGSYRNATIKRKDENMTSQKNRTIPIIAVVIVIIVAVVGYITLKNGNKDDEQEPSYKILFIGDSLTHWNDGFDYHIEKLASSADPPLIIKADIKVQDGSCLEELYKTTDARGKIENGDYDAVVLQEDLPLTFVETFHEYARKFDTVITETGAETVFLMSYAVDHPSIRAKARIEGNCLGFVPIGIVDSSHQDIAKELDCKVAPWGLAFYSAMAERPDLNLLNGDNLHPSIYGTYLAVNVVYATIFDESPEGLTYWPRDIHEDDAKFLQRVAWEIVQEYRTQ